MSTSLYILTDSKLTGNETSNDFDLILGKLTDLKLETTSYVGPKGKLVKEIGDWSYEIEPENKEEEVYFNISFEGPFSCTPTLYSNIGIFWTIYKYSLIYETKDIYWFEKFRKEIFEIVKIVGGTEIIYVADNACDKLNDYLNMAWINMSYDEIKKEMIKDLGNPVTDYRHMNHDKLDYSNINEFFLDDFNDLK